MSNTTDPAKWLKVHRNFISTGVNTETKGLWISLGTKQGYLAEKRAEVLIELITEKLNQDHMKRRKIERIKISGKSNRAN